MSDACLVLACNHCVSPLSLARLSDRCRVLSEVRLLSWYLWPVPRLACGSLLACMPSLHGGQGMIGYECAGEGSVQRQWALHQAGERPLRVRGWRHTVGGDL